ncbi:MAG: ESX secretion-associated protein EspG [Mycobacteriaceae bacterium]|nr:ESX secretion-associated protein EspG [Mycobacteriaceae bacterium]
MADDVCAADITVNLDGLWLLQALSGITRLAPELRGRPYGQPRSGQWLTQHPGLKVLVEQGVCDEGGVVRADLAARLAVLAAPDVEVILLVSSGPMRWSTPVALDEPATWRAIPAGQLRIVLARREGRWASAVRAGQHITIDDCEGDDPQWLAQLVCDGLDSIHPVAPAQISTVNVALDDMHAAAAHCCGAGDIASRHAALRAVGFGGAVLAELGPALDEPVAEAVLYARAHVDAATTWSESVLDVRDTASGRVVLYRLNPPHGSQQQWMAVGPATPAQLQHAVTTVLASVAVRSWNAHERMP